MDRIAYLGGSLGYDDIGLSSQILDIGADPDEKHPPKFRHGIDWGIQTAAVEGKEIVIGPQYDFFDKHPGLIDTLDITHAHVDHIGAIASALDYMKPDAPVLAAPQTWEMMPFILRDGFNFHPKYFSEHGGGTSAEVDLWTRRFPLRTGENEILPGQKMFADPAGHVNGAHSPIYTLSSGESILFTGDRAWHSQPLIRGARLFSEQLALGLITPERIPSYLGGTDLTYGAEGRKDPRIETKKLAAIIRETCGEGGITVIPAFAYGRAQNVALYLKEEGIEYPMYLDGSTFPLFEMFKKTKWSDLDENGFSLDGFERIRGPRDRLRILESGNPSVIFTTAGMGQGLTRHYFWKLGGDKRNAFVFVSWVSPASPGAAIIRAVINRDAVTFKVENNLDDPNSGTEVTVPVEARIYQLSFTSHGNLPEFIRFVDDWVNVVRGGKKLKFAAVTHGSLATRRKTAKILAEKYAERIEIPHKGDVFCL